MHHDDQKRAWMVSAGLHGGVFVVLGAGALVSWWWPDEPEPFVFEVVASAQASPEPLAPAPPTPLPVMPEDAPDITAPRTPPPEPLPAAAPTPPPPPQIKRVQYDPNRYAPTPRPVTPPPPQPTPAPVQPALSQAIRSMSEDMEQRLTATRQTQSANTPIVSMAELGRFQRAVHASIQVQWSRMQSASGLEALSAEVSFTLSPDGRQSAVQLARSSGDAAFDRAAVLAVSRAAMPATPDGEVYRLTIPVEQVPTGLR
ncbi:MAG: energy transducer TonB [Opitutales bacterium]